MSKTVQKITLSASRDIPFNKLVLSQSNVRRIKAGVSIEELAEDIARRTLLQSINVRPVLGADGAETGMFEIPAGGRRYRALELLVRQKRLAKTALVPCIVRDPLAAASLEEDSLAENVQRVALHPLDQFRAFQALRDQGAGEEEIAARFFVSPAVVKQRLRLAAVSPKLHNVYAEDGMSLEQLMAFSVSANHARQEQVWEALQRSYSKEPYQIRRMLTERAVRASDKRAQFVGIETYVAAGGSVMRDLFNHDDGGWLEDIVLLERLAAEKLKAAAETVAAEGWKWVTAANDFPYGHTDGLRPLDGEEVELTAEELAAQDTLQAEFTKLETEYEGADELPDDVHQRLGELERTLMAFEDRPRRYPPGEMARAGAFVSIGTDGDLLIERGYVRAEDEAPRATGGDDGPDVQALIDNAEAADSLAAGAAAPRPDVTVVGQTDLQDDEDDVVKPLPDRLLAELTAHRTLALRNAVADHPHVAMTLLLHKLVLDAFRHGTHGECLDASVRQVFFPVQATELKDSPPAKAIAERQAAWKAELPDDEDALWDWLDALDEPSRNALLAHCVSFGINALHEKVDRYGGGLSQHGLERRLYQADRLARATGLDMVEAGWRPTADNYLGRVTKPRILEAVREAKGEQAAQLIDHLKKADMAREAERLLDGTGWLPEPLRMLPGADVELDAAIAPKSGAEIAALPEFLGDGGDDDGAAADERSMIAAA